MRYSRGKHSAFKPSGPRPVNWGHPLTHGLRIVVPFHEQNGATVQELVTGIRGTISGTPDWQSRPGYGRGHATSNSDTKAFSWATDARWDFSHPPITLLAFGHWFSTTVAIEYIVANGINGQTRFSMSKNAAHNLGFSVRWGGAATTSSLNITANAPFFCATSYDGANVRYFYNGATQVVAYTNTPITTGDPFKIGKSSAGTTAPINGIVHGAYVWSRALSYSELSQLYADPFAFFVPFRRHRSLVGTGAGGGGGTRRPVSIIT